MSRFGDLLGGTSEPVVDTSPSSYEPAEETKGFGDMSKVELEEYGRTIGIELDRRQGKGKLIKQLEDHIQYIESI